MNDVVATLLAAGQAHEARGEFPAAIAAYDEALARLRGTDLNAPEVRRQLGLTWMNRGNALQKIAEADAADASVRAFDEAIAVLRTLPFETVPDDRNHYGAAWVNRGHAQMTTGDFAGAIASFESAIGVLAPLPLEANPYFLLNLTGAWTNLAQAHLALVQTERATAFVQAGAAAENALGLLAPVERAHPAFTEMSLRARRALVTALGEQLVHADVQGTPTAELASAASDAVDEGLSLARLCEEHGITHLRPLALRLFRMGAQLYRLHQPHFLAEFVLETFEVPNFAADADFQAVASEEIRRALAAVNRPQLFVAGTRDSDRLLDTSRALRAAADRVAALAQPSAPRT
jgi:tetratricopeptide (TPR) repeat protein